MQNKAAHKIGRRAIHLTAAEKRIAHGSVRRAANKEIRADAESAVHNAALPPPTATERLVFDFPEELDAK